MGGASDGSDRMETVSKEVIGRMFSALAPRYRWFNRWSSLGMDGAWRRSVLSELAGAPRVLDLGTGTGDLAWRLQARRSLVSWTVGLDLSLDMLTQARAEGDGPSPVWVQGSADQLPFRSGSFDGVVSAFVVRNLFVGGILPSAVREVARVLRPGGRVVFLDLTRPNRFWLRWGHGIYTQTFLPFFGRILFGRRWPGSYLAASIRALPGPETFERLFHECGLSGFEVRPLWGGLVSLYLGRK